MVFLKLNVAKMKNPQKPTGVRRDFPGVFKISAAQAFFSK
jgi:hypothetical protein